MTRWIGILTESEIQEAWHWVNRHGPSNSWTASFGTAARIIGRLLKEREHLVAVVAGMEAERNARTSTDTTVTEQ